MIRAAIPGATDKLVDELMTEVAKALAVERPRTFYLAAVLLTAFTLVWPFWFWNDAASFAENGPVEGLQSVYLIAATLLALLALRRPGPLTRTAICGIALLFFNLFVREMQVRGTWAEPYIGALFLHSRIFYILAILWIAVVGFGLRRFDENATDAIRWLMGPAGIALIVGGALYFAGDRAEKHWRHWGEPIEETLDLYASYFILLSGYLTLRFSSLSKRRGMADRQKADVANDGGVES